METKIDLPWTISNASYSIRIYRLFTSKKTTTYISHHTFQTCTARLATGSNPAGCAIMFRVFPLHSTTPEKRGLKTTEDALLPGSGDWGQTWTGQNTVRMNRQYPIGCHSNRIVAARCGINSRMHKLSQFFRSRHVARVAFWAENLN